MEFSKVLIVVVGVVAVCSAILAIKPATHRAHYFIDSYGRKIPFFERGSEGNAADMRQGGTFAQTIRSARKAMNDATREASGGDDADGQNPEAAANQASNGTDTRSGNGTAADTF